MRSQPQLTMTTNAVLTYKPSTAARYCSEGGETRCEFEVNLITVIFYFQTARRNNPLASQKNITQPQTGILGHTGAMHRMLP